MDRTIWIPTALLLLAACGDQAARDDASPAQPDGNTQAVTSPAVSEDLVDRGDGQAGRADEVGMSWIFSDSAGGPKLAYGIPQTDNLRLMLRCAEAGNVRFVFMRPASASPITRVTISSGGASSEVEAQSDASQLGGISVETELPVDSGPLIQFRSGHRINVSWTGGEISVPEAGQQADRLFEACA